MTTSPPLRRLIEGYLFARGWEKYQPLPERGDKRRTVPFPTYTKGRQKDYYLVEAIWHQIEHEERAAAGRARAQAAKEKAARDILPASESKDAA
jgi:hypothetical protein